MALACTQFKLGWERLVARAWGAAGHRKDPNLRGRLVGGEAASFFSRNKQNERRYDTEAPTSARHNRFGQRRPVYSMRIGAAAITPSGLSGFIGLQVTIPGLTCSTPAGVLTQDWGIKKKPRHPAGARFCRSVVWSRRAHAIVRQIRRKAQGDRRVNTGYSDSWSHWKS